MRETIYDVHWEGPFKWEECGKYLKPGHMLYGLSGAHHLYGRDVLLYLGRTDNGIAKRLTTHAEWVEYEYDAITVRVASVGVFTSWKTWEAIERPYPAVNSDVVRGIEGLLIYAHQPAYNSMSKSSLDRVSYGIRILNTGRIGHLLPEVSYLYHYGDE